MSKAISLDQLELHALKSANYTDKKIAELSEDVSDAIEEMADNLSSQTDEKIEAHLETKEYATQSEVRELENMFAGALLGMYGDDASATPPTIREIANDAIDNAIENGDIIGEPGEPGKPAYEYAQEGGYTGTESEFAEDINPDNLRSVIAQDIIAQLQGLPVFGIVDENNTIKVTSQLSNGTYTVKYENEDGTTTDIGTITVGNGGSGEPDNTTYEVDIDSIGYTDSARWSTSSGDIRTGATGYTAINKIPLNRASGKTATITLSGIAWTDDGLATQYAYILMYIGDSFTSGHNMPLKGLPKNYDDLGVSGVLNSDGTITITVVDGSKGLYDGFKLCGVGSGANAKVTITIQ